MFSDASIRKISIEQIEQAFGEALSQLTGKSHEVKINTIDLSNHGFAGSMSLNFGRPTIAAMGDDDPFK